MDIVTRTASVEAWPKAVAPPHIRRADASPGANRKRFMIRTSLRISLRRRNRTFVKRSPALLQRNFVGSVEMSQRFLLTACCGGG
jgi:hypothetical protein